MKLKHLLLLWLAELVHFSIVKERRDVEISEGAIEINWVTLRRDRSIKDALVGAIDGAASLGVLMGGLVLIYLIFFPVLASEAVSYAVYSCLLTVCFYVLFAIVNFYGAIDVEYSGLSVWHDKFVRKEMKNSIRLNDRGVRGIFSLDWSKIDDIKAVSELSVYIRYPTMVLALFAHNTGMTLIFSNKSDADCFLKFSNTHVT